MNDDFKFFQLQKKGEASQATEVLDSEGYQSIADLLNNTTSLLHTFFRALSKLAPYLEDGTKKENFTLITDKVIESLVKIQELSDLVGSFPHEKEATFK